MAAQQESRGQLKIFLGAAPGVGKTYEMLQSAHARRRDGVDVVVGIVETHGRQETLALVKGLEVVPRRQAEHKGRALDEMDLDAVLARRPQLVLVDELAHTNAPESRHPKRWQDVEELLGAGIDVYTTLNIQHVESLNDVVAQITRIRVRETVPDSIIDRADDIEIIDLTPKDLIQRLKDGKVYIAKTAERALAHYFSPGNLTALRELALRRTAQRVDQQLLTHMQANAIPGPWAASDRIVVCVDEGPQGPGLVRYAKRVAESLRAPFTALHVETVKSLRLTEGQRDRVAETLRLAERLGGEAVTLPGRDPADEIVSYAEANNATQLIVGSPGKSRWLEFIQGSVTHQLIRCAGDISVHVIAGRNQAEGVSANTKVASSARWLSLDAWPFVWTTLFIVLALGIGLALQKTIDVRNVALVFLTAVLASAVRYGIYVALYASFACVLALNFFFMPPLYTFTISEPENVVALFFFLVVAVIASNLTANVRGQAAAARQRAKATENLYLFSKKLASAGALDDVLWATAFQIALMLNVRVVLLLPENGGLVLRAGYPPEDTLEPADLAAAKWTSEHNRPAGRGADTLPGAKRLFLPMRTGRGAVGVVGIDRDKDGPLLSPEQRRLLDALIDQAALAIERVTLVGDVDRARLAAETDRLRQALLTSISHDLKTPLSGIMGAAGTLRDFSALLNDETKLDLIGTIQDESERLNRFIANLLDMTKLESGALVPTTAAHDIGEVVGSALQRASKILSDHKVDVELAADLPEVAIDAVLFEQVLFNLFDNAAKYSPGGSTVRVRSWSDDGFVALQVLDEGQGIPDGDVERIFDKFYRAAKGDSVRAGTGLGLPICRGFVEAMGGTITGANRKDRSGAAFLILMPTVSQMADRHESAA